MCIAVCYDSNNHNVIVNFSDPFAQIPVYTKQGPQLVIWGRCKRDSSALPFGGNLPKNYLMEGRWDKYFPKRVRISVQNFEMIDLEGQNKWYIITQGNWLEGVILRDHQEMRVYIVMLSPQSPKEPQGFYSHWPSIIIDGSI